LAGRKDGREQKKQKTEAIPDAIAVRPECVNDFETPSWFI
jgi:hypothetical protein